MAQIRRWHVILGGFLGAALALLGLLSDLPGAEAGVVMGRFRHTALGGAGVRMTSSAEGEVLTVENLRGSGFDGVRIDAAKGEMLSWQAGWDLCQSAGCCKPGLSARIEAQMIGGEPEGKTPFWLTLACAGTPGLTISTGFNGGRDSKRQAVTVSIYNDGVKVATKRIDRSARGLPGYNEAIRVTSEGEKLARDAVFPLRIGLDAANPMIPASFVARWTHAVSIEVGGDSPVMGSCIRIVADASSELYTFSDLKLTADGVASFRMGGEEGIDAGD